MSDDDGRVGLAMIDGRDALLMVLVRPSSEGHVTVDAHCNGLDKGQAARILMHVARQWRDEVERSADDR